MKSKVCSKCNIEKELSKFYKDKSKSDGHRSDCKKCIKYNSTIYPWKYVLKSIKEAGDLLNTSSCNIWDALNKKQNTAKGFIWRYKYAKNT